MDRPDEALVMIDGDYSDKVRAIISMCRRDPNYIWHTKDGRELKVRDMDDNHLINTIKMIVR